jgi:hypothetical protein
VKSIQIRQYGINFSIKKMIGLKIPNSATLSVIDVTWVVMNTVTLLDMITSTGEISIMER